MADAIVSPLVGAVAGPVIGGLLGGGSQSSAANAAADAQTAASNASIAEQRRQFDALQKLLEPYVAAGTGSLSAQQNLLGLNGNTAQQQYIDSIKNGSQFQALQQQGQNSILQNASATGGLRGGNTEAALAQFSPQLLNQLINDQYSKLGGMTSLGQNAAAMQGNAGIQSANNISGQLNQIGAAQAGSALASGRADAQMYGTLGQGAGLLGALGSAGMFNGLFGGSGSSNASSGIGYGLGSGLKGGMF